MTSMEQMLSPEYIKEVIDRNAKSLIAAGVLSILLVGGYYYVRVYRVEQEARAHATLMEVLAEVTRASSKPEAWQDVEVAARTGYRQHTSSSIAQYFLAIEADALIQQGKINEGREQLKSVVDSLPQHAPLKSSYALKLARLDLNTQDEALHNQGLASLESLAQDTKSLVHDEVLYRLGRAYAQAKNYDAARKTFQELIDTYKVSKDAAAESVWASLAQEAVDRLP